MKHTALAVRTHKIKSMEHNLGEVLLFNISILVSIICKIVLVFDIQINVLLKEKKKIINTYVSWRLFTQVYEKASPMALCTKSYTLDSQNMLLLPTRNLCGREQIFNYTWIKSTFSDMNSACWKYLF